MEEGVYSIILSYLDVTPVSRKTASAYEDQHHWLKRLQQAGDFAYREDVIDYKTIYILLALNNFDVDKTLLVTCREGIQEAARYLSDYSTKNARGLCVQQTSDMVITRSVKLEQDQIVSALIGRKDDRSAVTSILNDYALGLGSEDEYRILLTSESSDIVAAHASQDFAHLADAKAARVFDEVGYVYTIDIAIRDNLPRSARAWLDTNPTIHSIRASLLEAIRANTEVGVLLLSHDALPNRHDLVEHAVRSNNYWVLGKLPYTSKDLSLAISLSARESIRAMRSIATPIHVRQCTVQRKNIEAKILSGSVGIPR